MKPPQFDQISIGQEMPPLVKEPITEVQLVKYAGASGDFNPLHFQDALGKMAGQGGVIAHGMLIMGFMGQAITDWIPQKNLNNFKVRFVSVTRPGEAITVAGRVTGKETRGADNIITCELTASSQDGKVKATGSFEALL